MTIDIPTPSTEAAVLAAVYMAVAALAATAINSRSACRSVTAALLVAALGAGLMRYAAGGPAASYDLPSWPPRPEKLKDANLELYRAQVEAWEREMKTVQQIRATRTIPEVAADPAREATVAAALAIILAGGLLATVRTYCAYWDVS